MLAMILKMLASTVLHILASLLLWKFFGNKQLKVYEKILIGLIYGGFAVLSTHFGVEYSHMVINVRDLSPLTAGLFFDPVSGIIAGIVGGLERYLAGTLWGIGSYTAIACSVSTALAGVLSALLRIYVLRRKRPLVLSAFFIGAVMEVFHMYMVFFTHQDDMTTAFYVVRNCAIPMIVFSAIGLSLFTLFSGIMDGDKPFSVFGKKAYEFSILRIFQTGMLIATLVILLATFFFSYSFQSRTSVQAAEEVLLKASSALRINYEQVSESRENANRMAENTAMAAVGVVAEEVEKNGEMESVDAEYMQQIMEAFDLVSLNLVGVDGMSVVSAGSSQAYTSRFSEVLSGEAESRISMISDSRAAVGVHCPGGMVQAVISLDSFEDAMNDSGMNDFVTNFQVGNEGSFDIIRGIGTVVAGDHYQDILTRSEQVLLKEQEEREIFDAVFFGISSLCWTEELESGTTLLLTLPKAEVYNERDIQAYQTAFSDIILFAVVYAVLYTLVSYVIVRNLKKVNNSLDKIASGDLNEVVDVRTSKEFNSLSDDINETVSVLKGYITAAEKRMEQELEVAHMIQESALPRVFKFPRDDFSLYATMKPAREVGGDFYDFFFISGRILCMVIADVSGKGIPAALFMMRCRTMIQSKAREGDMPAEIFYNCNNILCSGNEAEMFVTAWFGMFDLETGVMRCANAGHEYPIIKRQGGDFELYKDPHGLVLAGMENMKYTEYEIRFDPGDKLFVYTDGIPEAINGEREQYGTERLIRTLNTLKDSDPAEMLPAVMDDIRQFVGDEVQFDDITMLGFEYKGNKTLNMED